MSARQATQKIGTDLARDRARAVTLVGDSVSRETWERLDGLVADARSRTQPWLRTDVKDKWRALRESLEPDDRAQGTTKTIGGQTYDLTDAAQNVQASLAMLSESYKKHNGDLREVASDYVGRGTSTSATAQRAGYLTLEVSRLYQGPVLDLSRISQAEQYTYSAVWLSFGVVV